MPFPSNSLRFPPKVRTSGKDGSIIVLVLLFVVLLTFVVIAFLEDATARIKYYGLFHNRDDLRVDAYSAMEITLASINQYREIEGALWGPAQGWGNPLVEAGFSPANATDVSVSFVDESGKLPLTSMALEDWLLFFEVLGFDLPEREALSDGLLDWMDEDDVRNLNGFDGEDYEDLDPPYRPANGPIQSWDEFRLIHPFHELFFNETGDPLPVFQRFRESVSLFHTGDININGAPDTVLNYFEEKGFLDLRRFLDYRDGADGIPGTEDDRLLRPEANAGLLSEEAAGLGTEITLLRVLVRAQRGEARFDLEAMVTWSGSNAGAAGTRSAEPSRAGEAVDEGDRSADNQRRRARGNTRTAPATEAQLGYPFRFVRLTENRKF